MHLEWGPLPAVQTHNLPKTTYLVPIIKSKYLYIGPIKAVHYEMYAIGLCTECHILFCQTLKWVGSKPYFVPAAPTIFGVMHDGKMLGKVELFLLWY